MSFSYIEFENRFRGTSDVVRKEQTRFIPYFACAPGPVVDLGCGRGEFLEMLGTAGATCWGVDVNKEMVDFARARGLDVRHESAIAHLASCPPESLGGIFMSHVIEHLPRPDVLKLGELAASRLRRGGVIVVETLNPQCVFANAPFAMDFTHEWPIHPQTLQFILEGNGFEVFETVYRQYLPDEMMTLMNDRTKPSSWPTPTTPFECAVTEALGKLQLYIDLAFKNFIYALAARRGRSSK